MVRVNIMEVSVIGTLMYRASTFIFIIDVIGKKIAREKNPEIEIVESTS